MQSTAKKDALYFVTEQACCLAQAQGRETDDFRAFQEVAEYLAGGDEGALADFRERTGAMKHDLTGLEDYDIEQYDGKRADVVDAVSALNCRGSAPDTPDGIRGAILKAADIIAAFYDVDNDVSAVPA
jgi:hypothetical protein